MHADLALAIAAAQAAARVVRYHRGRTEPASKRDRADLVTQADVESEQAIRAVLLAAHADDTIVGEERGAAPGTSSRRWIVDPIDGTLNFVAGLPYYCVSIALEESGALTVGVVLDVAHDVLYAARRGDGAHANGVPLGVSATTSLDDAMLITGFTFSGDASEIARRMAIVARAVATVRGVRRFGAAALDLMQVAAGRADGYWERGLNAWDVAAGLVIVAEAGGTVTNHVGVPARLGDAVTVASNGALHAALLDLVRDA